MVGIYHSKKKNNCSRMSLNANVAFTPLQDINKADVSHKVNISQFGKTNAGLLSLFRGRHAHHAAVGCGRVWQGVQPFHSWPAVGARRRHAAGAEACVCGEGPLLGHWL